MIKVRKAKKECTEAGAKPTPVKTHLRDCIITPEMVGSVVAIHTGKIFNNVEIKVYFFIKVRYDRNLFRRICNDI